MKRLLEKLEALVDEATLLVREERARRAIAAPPMTSTGPTLTPFAPYKPSRTAPADWAQPFVPPFEYGSTIVGGELPAQQIQAWNGPIDVGCATPQLGQVWTGMSGPAPLGHLHHH